MASGSAIVKDEILVPSLDQVMQRFTVLDYACLGLVLLISGAIGIYWAFKDAVDVSVRGMLTGNGTVSSVAASVSIVGTYISAGLLLGITANIYDYGTMYFAIVGSQGLAIYMTAEFFVPVFHSLKVLTCFQFLELRFGSTVRRIAVYLYIVQMLCYQAISLFAPAQALSQVTGISEWNVMIAIGLVCTVYTAFGGIKAVIYTDCFQCGAIILSMLVIVGLGFYEAGGVSEVFNAAKAGHRIVYDDFRIDPTLSHSFWALILGASVPNLASYATNQMMVARYLTVSSVRKAKIAAWMSWPVLILTVALSSLSGLLAYARYAGCDPLRTAQIKSSDEVLPYFVMEALGKHTGIPGVFALVMFAASLSSVSSGINSLASVAYVDIIADRWPKLSGKTASRSMVGLGVFFGLLSMAVVAILKAMGSALEVAVAVNSGIGSMILGLFVVGIFLRRVDPKSALMGAVASAALSFVMNMGPISTEADAMEPLPRSVANCGTFHWNSTGDSPTTGTGVQPFLHLEDASHAFKISYLWYPAMSLIVQVTVSFLSSLCLGGDGAEDGDEMVKDPENPEPIEIIARQTRVEIET